MDNYDSYSNYWNEMDGIGVVLMGAVHSGNDRVGGDETLYKTRKDIVIRQQAKPSRMQAAFHTT